MQETIRSDRGEKGGVGDSGAANARKSDGRKVGTGKRRGQQPLKLAGHAHGSPLH